jgi:iron complex outermembrane receptor protein
MGIKQLLLTSTAVATALSLGGLTAAFAQEAERADVTGLEEIVVTAQKRSENLQDVPIAISAFTGDQILEDGIASLEDIGNRTPGMVFAAFSVGQPEIAIRGVGTKEDGASASDSVIISVDDVYIAARTAQVFDIFDLERVEVLRGPQGTLYGKNTAGGAINFVTMKPSEETKIRVRQTVGDYGRFDTGAMLSGQIAENLFGKVSFSRRQHDGYLRNILQGSEFFGQRQGESNTFAWRAQLRWTPSEQTEVLLSLDGADDNLGASNREPVGSAGPLHNCGCASDPIAVNIALGGDGNGHTTLADTEGFTDREVQGYSLKITQDFENLTLTSISAYRESDFDWLEDSEGLPPWPGLIDLTGTLGSPLVGLLAPPEEGFSFDVNDSAIEATEQITQEFRLANSGDSKLQWTAGLFYSREEISRTETFEFPALGGPGGNDITASVQENTTKSFAAYADGTYAISDDLSFTAGLRYSSDKREIGAEGQVIQGLGLLIKPFDHVTASGKWDNVAWRAVMSYRVNADVMAYASAATGFKSGGFTGSASTADRATTPFDQEKATNYEVGIKSRLLDNRLQLNITAFYTDYTDLQVTRFFQPVDAAFGEFITENAGKAEMKGVEAEFVALPIEQIEIGGSYAYLDAKYTDFQGTPSLAADGSILESGAFNGNRLRQAPETMLSFYGKFTQQLEKGSISAKVSYRYQGLSFYGPSNNPIETIPAYDIWDARLAWRSDNDNWEAAVWVRNFGDEQYRTHVFTQRGGRVAFATYGAPRTFGLTLSYDY